MRNLQAKDLFTLGRVLKGIKPQEVIKEVNEDTTINKENPKVAGVAIIFGILERAVEKKSEEKIFEFLAGPMEMTPKQVSELDPIDLIEGLFEIASFEKWKDFLSRASKLMS